MKSWIKSHVTVVLSALMVSLSVTAEEAPPVKGKTFKTKSGAEKPVNEPMGTIVTPKVYFISPKDREKLPKKTFKVKMGVAGMKVKPAGTMDVGTGHHHIVIDGGPIPKGQVVPADAQNIHYGKGETEVELTLTPGRHTLTLQFADGSHKSYGPELSQTITVYIP